MPQAQIKTWLCACICMCGKSIKFHHKQNANFLCKKMLQETIKFESLFLKISFPLNRMLSLEMIVICFAMQNFKYPKT